MESSTRTGPRRVTKITQSLVYMSVDEYYYSACSVCCADPCAKLAPTAFCRCWHDVTILRQPEGAKGGPRWPQVGPSWTLHGPPIDPRAVHAFVAEPRPPGPRSILACSGWAHNGPEGPRRSGPPKMQSQLARSLREACARLARKAAPKISGAPGVILKWPSGPLALVARWPGGLGGPNGPVASRGLRKLPQKARTQL